LADFAWILSDFRRTVVCLSMDRESSTTIKEVTRMPLYEYQCRACSHGFETLVRSGDDQPACPACGSPDIERLLSSFGVSSEARSHATLQSARREFTYSAERKDRIRHEAEQVRDHVQEDYGLRVPKIKD
jgi:putative FmdB family regulatory protein